MDRNDFFFCTFVEAKNDECIDIQLWEKEKRDLERKKCEKVVSFFWGERMHMNLLKKVRYTLRSRLSIIKNVAFMCHFLINVPIDRRVEPFIPCTKTCDVYLCMYVCIFSTHECYEVCM